MDPDNAQNYSKQQNINNDDFDLQRYFGLFLSNWYWFALTLFIAGLIASGINNYSERIYTVNASLLINDEQIGSDVNSIDKLIPGGDLFRSQQNLQNEIGILKSYSLNYRVMKELPEFHVTIIEIGRRSIAQKIHYKTAPFIVVFDSLTNQSAGVPISLKILSDTSFSIEIDGKEPGKKSYVFGEKINEMGFNFAVINRDPSKFKFNPAFSNRFIFSLNRLESLANNYRNKLAIVPVNKDATLVTLSVSGDVPLQEADYLNKLMDLYLTQGLEFKNQTAINTIDFIDQQLKFISDSLSRAEKNLEKFRLTNNIIDLSSEGTAIKTRLESYTNEKISATLQKQYYKYLANYIETRNESGAIISPSVMGVSDQMLIKLVEELASLQSQMKQMDYSFTKNLPAIGLIESKIEDSRNALKENVRNSILNIENVLKDIDSRILTEEAGFNRLPGTERELINIQRKFDLNNTVYTYMLEKRSEAGIAKASKVSSNRIIDRAESFNCVRIKPKENKNYLLAIIFGLLVPGIYIFLVDQFHSKILDKKDIERGTRAPIIGFIGHNSSKNEIPVVSKPGSSLAESFRSVRTNLKYYYNGEKKAVISVTSTISGEGKTFISLNLAAVLSMLNKKTLLVGVDLRKPRLDKILNSKGDVGLSTYLIEESDFDEIILKTEVANLFFVPSGSIPPNPTELLESERMRLFMQKARSEFDYIVLDTPPVGIVSDALMLGNFADINIFVIRQRFSFKNTLELIQNIFEKKELKNLMICVNDIYVSGYYGYGLRYGYGFYEGYGYNYGYRQYGSYGHGDYQKYYTED